MVSWSGYRLIRGRVIDDRWDLRSTSRRYFQCGWVYSRGNSLVSSGNLSSGKLSAKECSRFDTGFKGLNVNETVTTRY